ncbi:Hypothetical_protein [Hexamita inflata]|uniref:Hypothetical_protein n=1 Tax=Hexamita inflata TaxID=28002 RepID=A0AA86NH53_9EUKA|nr:Hypothetical protein HINF_LOCUS6997 [Hexamita inflata]
MPKKLSNKLKQMAKRKQVSNELNSQRNIETSLTPFKQPRLQNFNQGSNIKTWQLVSILHQYCIKYNINMNQSVQSIINSERFQQYLRNTEYKILQYEHILYESYLEILRENLYYEFVKDILFRQYCNPFNYFDYELNYYDSEDSSDYYDYDE